MDIDFHYYATYVAALLAGYAKEDAATIAHSGQYIDDSDPNRLLDSKRLGFDPVTTVFTTGQEVNRNRDWSEMTIAHDRAMWTAFHFLPGNIDLHIPYTGPTRHSGHWEQNWGYGVLAEQQFRTMCLPASPLAVRMVNDTMEHHAGDLYLIGVRMHVLIDTFAHMLYCGSAAWHVNEVENNPEVWRDGDWKSVDIPTFTYTPSFGIYYNSIIYTGHGRMGHVPDLPWARYRYQPKWSNAKIEKNNPQRYSEAFCEMVQAMSAIRGRRTYVPGVALDPSSAAARALPLVQRIIAMEPTSADVRDWGILNDFTDERCQNWIDALPELRQATHLALPQPPVYSADTWLENAERSLHVGMTHYAKWHRAAAAHLAFVKSAVAEAGLTLLGQAPFLCKEDLAHVLGQRVKIRPGKGGSYWEVNGSERGAGHAVQLWDDDTPRQALLWVIQHAGKGNDGYDRFKIYNPTLDSYATFVGKPNASGQELDGCRVLSGGKDDKTGVQSFAMIKHVSGNVTHYSFYVANEYALQPEDGQTGNSTKVIAKRQGADDLESLHWELIPT